jgi:UDP-glucose 4-epimerase
VSTSEGGSAGSRPEDYYAGRRVLITGGNGFLGLNLLAALRRLGADVGILSRSEVPGGGELGLLAKPDRHHRGDIRDPDFVAAAVEGCAVVFNLAAHSGSISSNDEPFEDLDINLRGQLTLLEQCRLLDPLPRIVYASSRLVYQPTGDLPVCESALTGPLSLYGVHKLAGEHYHLLYRRLYGMPAVILRITNPYGAFQRGSQSRYGIINFFIHQAVHGLVLPIYGDGRQLRDYVHVDDVVRAFLAAGARDEADGKILNVGSGVGVSFQEMAEAIVRDAGSGEVKHQAWPPDAARVETGDFVADISRIGEVLGWRPAISFQEGLKAVVEHYRGAAENPAR